MVRKSVTWEGKGEKGVVSGYDAKDVDVEVKRMRTRKRTHR